MNVILFGPPGIGKSTTIRRLAEIAPDRAIDLEDPDQRHLLGIMGWDWMFNQGRLGGRNYIGGADLDPHAWYPNTQKVVLVLDELVYKDRRLQRDRCIPSKRRQAPQTVESWRGIPDAIYLTADDTLVEKLTNIVSGGD